MSLQTQAILPGHLTAAELAARLEQVSGVTALGYRMIRVPQHVLFEFESSEGEVRCVEAFLDSWAAEDYAAVFAGPSTLLTMEYSPVAVGLLGALTSPTGLMRKHDMAEWHRSPPTI